MKRYITTLVLFCTMSVVASAQVVKQVEVTKSYAPEIGEAQKLNLTPNLDDNEDMKLGSDEVDYSVTMQPFASELSTHQFKPAKVTYWEYEHKHPFYLKLGVGYPLNTVGDLYASTHRADVGYLVGYINHNGQYSKLKYKDGFNNNTLYKDNRSLQMNNRFGVMGGKYFGRYTLAGDVNYSMNLYHRYPFHNQYAEDGVTPVLEYKNRKVDYDDVKLSLSFGDSFTDYSCLNFKVYASADIYNDKSEHFIAESRYQQLNATAGAALAREITKRSALSLNVDYEGYYGLKSLKAYRNSIVGADLRYSYHSGGLVDLSVGAKVQYDNNPADTKPNRWHAFPYLSLSLNVNDKGAFMPYVEVDGELQNNSYYSLVRRNPYVAILGGVHGSLSADSVVPNTELYNVRFGVSGHTADSKFAYRFYANMSFMRNAIYWYNINQIFFGVESASRNIWSLCGAVDYKPISQLLITAQVKGSLYTNFANVADAMPNVEALVRVRYTHEKFTVGLTAELYGPTKWTCVRDYSLFSPEAIQPVSTDMFSAPTSLNLSLYGDYHVNKTCTVYGEVNNILGDVMPTYHWAFYREMGASFTVGVKVQF